MEQVQKQPPAKKPRKSKKQSSLSIIIKPIIVSFN